MKWVSLAILLASIAPATTWVRKRPDRLNWLCFLIGFLPFTSYSLHLFTAPISWAYWVGYLKGLEIYVIDIVAIVTLLALRGHINRPRFIIPMGLYFVATVVATFGATSPEPAIFYCWQLLRVFLLYFAVANVCALEFEAIAAILKGLVAGELLECVVAVWQRVGHHVLQTPGTLGSQNELGLASHFVIFPCFAIMLGGQRGWLPPVAVLAGLLTDALTTSRAAVGLGLAGLALVWLLSSVRKFTGRKFATLVVGLIVLTLVAPLAVASFGERFERSNEGLAEDGERLAFKRAAWMMIDDHPGGVGPNNFALVANVGGYYTRTGGVSEAGRSSNVHNIYILIWAETGLAGLASYLVIFASVLIVALRYGAFSLGRDPNDPRKDVLIGVTVTLLIVSIHSTEEWIAIGSVLQYLLAITFGIVSGLTVPQRASNLAQGSLFSIYSASDRSVAFPSSHLGT